MSENNTSPVLWWQGGSPEATPASAADTSVATVTLPAYEALSLVLDGIKHEASNGCRREKIQKLTDLAADAARGLVPSEMPYKNGVRVISNYTVQFSGEEKKPEPAPTQGSTTELVRIPGASPLKTKPRAIVNTCACGRKIRGPSIYQHVKACRYAKLAKYQPRKK